MKTHILQLPRAPYASQLLVEVTPQNERTGLHQVWFLGLRMSSTFIFIHRVFLLNVLCAKKIKQTNKTQLSVVFAVMCCYHEYQKRFKCGLLNDGHQLCVPDTALCALSNWRNASCVPWVFSKCARCVISQGLGTSYNCTWCESSPSIKCPSA